MRMDLRGSAAMPRSASEKLDSFFARLVSQPQLNSSSSALSVVCGWLVLCDAWSHNLWLHNPHLFQNAPHGKVVLVSLSHPSWSRNARISIVQAAEIAGHPRSSSESLGPAGRVICAPDGSITTTTVLQGSIAATTEQVFPILGLAHVSYASLEPLQSVG